MASLKKSDNIFPVIGVGASAGGLAAFKEFIQAIPPDSNMAYVLVQHLDPSHESMLPELLQGCSAIPVLKIEDSITVEPNNVYIVPSNNMLISNEGQLHLTPMPKHADKEKSLPIDFFFKSLAQVYQSHAIGVILTGQGSDGTAGLKAIKDSGGITFSQSEETAEYASMPKSANMEGVVDFTLPPRDIPPRIMEVVHHLYADVWNHKETDHENQQVYKQILALLRIRKGTDFTYYKQTTIRRRILRRIALSSTDNPAAYLEMLRGNQQEQDILHQDLLIPVTEFFRDKDLFEVLCNDIFPEVLENKNEKEPVRIWVAGCSTGQEAYTIAMCLIDYLQERNSEESFPLKVQLFGTDISEKAIAKARSGIYTRSEVDSLAPEYIDRFFTKVDSKFQIKKEVRELCVFASHNFLKDPPFGKMDIITCRNVLIYLQPYLQKKAITTFHYALNKEGYLILGKSETTNNAPELFNQSEKHQKIFIPKDRPGRFMQVASQAREDKFRNFGKTFKAENARTDFQRTADEIILSRYTPAGVVIDEAMDIVHFRGRTGTYLEPQAGKPNLNLLKMAKQGLAFELRSLVHHAKKGGDAVTKENIPIEDGNKQRIISIEAIPLPNLAEPYYLILFHDPMAQAGAMGFQGFEAYDTAPSENKQDEKDLLIKQLKRELTQAREDMRSITEDQEATNEELQSANEELQSGSEELQTLNEELETSKEELQSTNEELTSLYQELVSMNKSLTTARNFAVDILKTVREPWVVIDQNLRIKSANHLFYKIFRTNEEEMENRSILTLGQKQWKEPELEQLLKKVLAEKKSISGYEITQEFPDIGERTMILNAREIVREEGGEKLILLVFGDITDKRLAEQSLEKSEIKFKLLAETIPQLIWITNPAGEFEYFNSKWKQYTGISSFEHSQKIEDAWSDFVHHNDLQKVLKSWRRSLESGESFAQECRLKSANGTYNWFLIKALPLFSTDGEIIKWFGSSTNIELQKEAEQALFKSREHFKELAELIPEKVSYADPVGNVEYYNRSWLQYTGLNLQELKDSGWIKIIHPDERRKVVESWKACLASGSDFEVEMRCLNRKGEYKWHLSRAVPVKDDTGKVKKWIAATTEIEKIKEEENRKEGFLQLVSHELKTPVTSIKGYVQLLLNLLEQESSYSIGSLPLKSSLKRIDDQVSRLTRLISEMLDVSRIEDNRLELKKQIFSLNELVTETVQDINRTEIDHNISVEEDEECVVHADKDRIGQVIINFITNAIKYSPNEKGIVVKTFKNLKGEVGVSVKDQGIGISHADQKEIFKRFHRVEGKNEETYSGLGIGLFLANEIVIRHGGYINVISEPGKGSEFTFTLPVSCNKMKNDGK
ncbi:CheR family methyltransferase [Salinimicrobium oceani]|uniref:histidine kinase n=1 Tax=Salinimicrobium oceani TaxID=2722702 RepID=A0ABX1CUW4_9FLAO|nr:CheR family methyltransferase [Salinimicrobium oceani]NJW51547.1 PAS domain-containing protein [Salinimicrobium oceani]